MARLIFRTTEQDYPLFEDAIVEPVVIATFLIALLDDRTVRSQPVWPPEAVAEAQAGLEDFWVMDTDQMSGPRGGLRGDRWLATNREIRPLRAGQRVYVPATPAHGRRKARPGYIALIDAIFIGPGRGYLRLRSGHRRSSAAAAVTWPLAAGHQLRPCD